MSFELHLNLTSTTMVVGEAQEQIMFFEKIEDKQGLSSAKLGV